MTTTNAALRDWVAEVASLTHPDRVQWCDGSPSERDALIELMLCIATFLIIVSPFPLNSNTNLIEFKFYLNFYLLNFEALKYLHGPLSKLE